VRDLGRLPRAVPIAPRATDPLCFTPKLNVAIAKVGLLAPGSAVRSAPSQVSPVALCGGRPQLQWRGPRRIYTGFPSPGSRRHALCPGYFSEASTRLSKKDGSVNPQNTGKPLAYNCSPSINWKQNRGEDAIELWKIYGES